MAFDFTLTSNESSYLLSNRPTADAIWNALQTIRLPSACTWVSPLARISRVNSLTTWDTSVTWVLEVNGPYTPESAAEIARQVGLQMDAALGPLSSDWTETLVEPFNEAKYGPLSSWRSGGAATPRVDNTAIERAEKNLQNAQDVGAAAAEVSLKAAAAAGSYVESAATRAGSILGNTLNSAIKPLGLSGPIILATVAGIALIVVLIKVRPSPAART